ncbi:MAG: cell division protein FtsZ [Bacteroidota bacterium]|jgi:cell division protein ftsZ|nr:MAG: cell division protein FtsZ [Bacteroidota bacterium]
MTAQDLLKDINFENLNYTMTAKHNIIKVIGVGGGGCNAVANMYNDNVEGVTFVVCNTDDQALQNSPIPNQILLGDAGLGAGNDPEKAREAAQASLTEIRDMLIDNAEGVTGKDGSLKINTKMAFITAGMGGGTGTGAAPVIAEVCHQLGILTVGIVTIPFDFEPPKKMRQALDGIARMSPFLDSLLVIRNDQIPKIFPEHKFSSFMRLADGILANAAKSIVEIITKNGYINVDFADVCTTLKNGGRTIMNFGQASGEHRVTNAIKEAMNTPLLFEYEVEKTKKMLIAVYTSPSNEITSTEMSEIKLLMETLDKDIEFIWGAFFDDSLGDEVKITLIATCSDDNVVPKPIDVMIKNNEYTKIKDRSTLYIEDLDSQELLKQIQEIPAYKRVEGL